MIPATESPFIMAAHKPSYSLMILIGGGVLWLLAWASSVVLTDPYPRGIYFIAMVPDLVYWAFTCVPTVLLSAALSRMAFSMLPAFVIPPPFVNEVGGSIQQQMFASLIVTFMAVAMVSGVAWFASKVDPLGARRRFREVWTAMACGVAVAAVQLPHWDLSPEPEMWTIVSGTLASPTVYILDAVFGIADPFAYGFEPQAAAAVAQHAGFHVLTTSVLLLCGWYLVLAIGKVMPSCWMMQRPDERMNRHESD